MISTCLHYAVDIQRNAEMQDWIARIQRVPVECCGDVEGYLRDMAHRLRVARAIRRELKARELLA